MSDFSEWLDSLGTHHMLYIVYKQFNQRKFTSNITFQQTWDSPRHFLSLMRLCLCLQV